MMLLMLIPIALLLYGCYLWIVAMDYRHLPGNLGSGFPIIGNLYRSLQNSFLSHDELLSILTRLLPQGRGLYCIWVYCKPVFAVSDPNFIEKLVIHPGISNKEPLLYENLPNLWKGPFTMSSADKEWKQRRKELTHTLKQPNLDNYHRTFVEISQRMVDKMNEQQGVFDLHRYVQMASAESIVETHFGCDLNTMDQNELYKSFVRCESIISKTFTLNPLICDYFNMLTAYYPQQLHPINQLTLMCVERTMADIEKKKFIEGGNDLLYAEVIIKRNISMNKSTRHMGLEVLDLIMVGSHTVAICTCSALYFLAALPEIQEKVWLEQKEIFGDSDRDPTVNDVRKMEYLERVIKETLRFVSGASMVRKTEMEINIDGIIIPSNTMVLLCSRIMRMDEQYWENPTKFDPDRYLKQEPCQKFKQAFSTLGFGTRNCPGGRYAFDQAKVFISTVLRRFEVVSDVSFEDIKLTAEIMMRIKSGYNISVIRRLI